MLGANTVDCLSDLYFSTEHFFRNSFYYALQFSSLNCLFLINIIKNEDRNVMHNCFLEHAV